MSTEYWVNLDGGFSRIPDNEITERVSIALKELKELKEKAKTDELALIRLREENNKYRLENNLLQSTNWKPNQEIDPIAIEVKKSYWLTLSVETQLEYLEYHQEQNEIWSEIVFLSRGKNALKEHKEKRDEKKRLDVEEQRKAISEGKVQKPLKPSEYIYSANPAEDKAIKGVMRSFQLSYSPANVAIARDMVEKMKGIK